MAPTDVEVERAERVPARARRAVGVSPAPSKPARRGMTTWTVGTFFALTFALGWGVLGVLILFTARIEAIFGPVRMTNPVFLLAVYSPAISGVFLGWRHHGWEGLRSYLKRVTLWRMPAAWWAFLLLGIPAIVYVSAAIGGTITDGFPFSPWYGVFPALAITLAIGPLEEFGWRGVALPLLQRRFAPL